MASPEDPEQGSPLMLRREDRLTGAALLCRRHGMLRAGIARGKARAFLFERPDEAGAGSV